MSAASTRLNKFSGQDGKVVYAAKIRAIEDFNMAGAPQGSKILHFEDPRRQSNLVGEWVAQNRPAVGGYFIVFDNSSGQSVASYIPAETFESQYVRAS